MIDLDHLDGWIVPSRNVLLVHPLGISPESWQALEARDWDLHVALDLRSAERLIAERRFLVGYLATFDTSAQACSEVERFLHAHSQMEWVGGFEPAALESQPWRDLIYQRMFDHLTLPVDAERLAATLGHAYGRACLRGGLSECEPAEKRLHIVGQAPAIKLLLQQVRRIAKVDAPVLICGESGTGKELVAQAIRTASSRAGGPFVVVNCGAIPASLIQSELFGHEKGSFTGADRMRRGLFESADGGTLFLDEIGDLPLEMQTNLLRFLQESTIDRVGSVKPVHVDVRVIAATNVDLELAVAKGAFRKDLYYRLNVLPISVPPLRERGEDIMLLAEHYFDKLARDRGHTLKGFSRSAMNAIVAHDWPGNVRELINRVRRAMVLAEGRLIKPADLGLESFEAEVERKIPLDQARMNAEKMAIAESLMAAGHNVSSAAKQLKISRMTLYRLMAKHNIGTSSSYN